MVFHETFDSMARFATAAAAIGVGLAQNLCVQDFGNSTFNIEPLVNQDAYAVKDASNNIASRNYTYVFNFCKDVDPLASFTLAQYPACNTTFPGNGPYSSYTQSGPALAFQVAMFNAGSGDQCHRLGGAASASTISYGLIDPTNPSRGLFVQYGGGDLCPPTLQTGRSLRVMIPCEPDAYNRPNDEIVQESATCTYELWIPSAYGCPSQCPVVNIAGKLSLCSGHGICDFDAGTGNSKCFCNDGYSGAACNQANTAPAGLSTVGSMLVAVCIFLVATLGFLGYLWMRIRSLRLDPAAYSSLRAGPGEESVN